MILRSLFLGLALTALAAAPAAAQTKHDHEHHIDLDDGDSPSRIVSRMPLADADFAVVTQRRDAALLIEGDEIVLQLTDRGLARIEKIGDEHHGSDVTSRVLAKAFFAALRGGIRAMLDHGIAYPIAEIQRVRWDGTRMRFETRNGGEIFEDVDVDGRDLMADFSVREAKAFIAAFEAAKKRQR